MHKINFNLYLTPYIIYISIKLTSPIPHSLYNKLKTDCAAKSKPETIKLEDDLGQCLCDPEL